jgi:hypothetical protein
MRPINRFGLDLKRIRFLPPDRFNDELFFAEETRKVKKDNTLPLNNLRYEVCTDLRDKDIVIRFNKSKKNTVIVYYKNNRIGMAKPVDLIGRVAIPCDRHTNIFLRVPWSPGPCTSRIRS